MNHGVSFEVNGVIKHSLDDFGLWLNPVEIPYPDLKENYIEKQFADGSIDLTDADGRVYFKDRAFPVSFNCNDKKRYTAALNDLLRFLHGKTCRMIFYFDPDFYYSGRAKFNKYTSDKGLGTIDLDVTCRPYKYAVNKTTETVATTSADYVKYTFQNGAMPSVPTFMCDHESTVKFGDNEYGISANQETIFPNIIFMSGANDVYLKGASYNWTITYQQGEI